MFGPCCFVRTLALVLFITPWLVLAKIECTLHVALPVNWFQQVQPSRQYTLSVLRIFVHSVSCHFFLSKIVQLKFFCEITTFTSIFLSFDTKIFQHGLDYFFYDFKPNFLLEAGQILERSQWIQIL